jgi:DNA-binding GntR family transcriptional regulator
VASDGCDALPGSSSVHERAYRALRQAIVSAELEPGQPLASGEVDSRVRVEPRVRDLALLRLVDDGLVAPVSGRRGIAMIVEPVCRRAIAEAWASSESVVGRAVSACIEHASAGEIEAMWRRVESAEGALGAGDYARFCGAVDGTLFAVCRIAGLGGACVQIQHDNWQFDRLRWLGLGRPGSARRLLDGQRGLARAISDGDELAAQRALSTYMQTIGLSVATIERETPWYFARGGLRGGRRGDGHRWPRRERRETAPRPHDAFARSIGSVRGRLATDVARFSVADPAIVVAASFACPYCLALAHEVIVHPHRGRRLHRAGALSVGLAGTSGLMPSISCDSRLLRQGRSRSAGPRHASRIEVRDRPDGRGSVGPTRGACPQRHAAMRLRQLHGASPQESGTRRQWRRMCTEADSARRAGPSGPPRSGAVTSLAVRSRHVEHAVPSGVRTA